MLQLESFIDPTMIKGLTLSKDPVPNFRKLEADYSSGLLTVPVTGAGTANTEFEAITGMNLHFFGPGEFPYKGILKKKTVESIPYDLMNLGYSTHAIHDHTGVFYGRNVVFPNMGFQTFTSVEYMNDVLKTPKNFEKDGVLTEEIIIHAQIHKKAGFSFIRSPSKGTENIRQTRSIRIRHRRLGDPAQSDANAVIYYVQQVHDMDVFIGQLTKALQI